MARWNFRIMTFLNDRYSINYSLKALYNGLSMMGSIYDGLYISLDVKEFISWMKRNAFEFTGLDELKMVGNEYISPDRKWLVYLNKDKDGDIFIQVRQIAEDGKSSTIDTSPANVKQLDAGFLYEVFAKNTQRPLALGTRESYERVINQFNQFIADNDLTIDTESIRAYLNSKSQETTALMCKYYALLKVIRAQFGASSLLEMGLKEVVEAMPMYQANLKVRYSEKSLLQGFLSQKMVMSLMNAAPTWKTRLIIQFLFKTGCCVSEMINIKLSDCEFVNNEWVEIRITGRSKRERIVYIPRILDDEIRNVYNGRTWLFETSSGRQLHRCNVDKQLRRVGKKIGINVHAHLLRHSRAIDLLLIKKCSLEVTSNLLGHSSKGVTVRMYSRGKVNPEELFKQDII